MSDPTESSAPGAADERSRALARVKKLARLMDSSITLPGGATIGLDGLIGLIPGIGDFGTALVSAYIILEAARMGARRGVLLRMLLNVGVEVLVGTIPILGDAFDFIWKANDRNVALLERSLAPPRDTR